MEMYCLREDGEMSDSDSLVGLALQYHKPRKPLLELAGNGAPYGQMRFTKQ